MQSRLRQLFDSLQLPDAEGCWRPPIDVYEGPDGWLIKVDLAGVRPEDIEVCWRDRVVEIAGIRRDLALLQGQRAYSMEISYNRFRREVELPCPVHGARVQTDYRDGMLLISILLREPLA